MNSNAARERRVLATPRSPALQANSLPSEPPVVECIFREFWGGSFSIEMHDDSFIIEEIKKVVRHNQQLIIGRQPLTFFFLYR